MKTALKIAIVVLLLILLASAVAFAVIGYWMPYQNAVATFPADRQLTLYQLENGGVRILWPESAETNTYLVEVLIPSNDPETEPQVEFSQVVSGWTGVNVSKLSGYRTIRIRPVREYRWPFAETSRFRISEDAILVTDTFAQPKVQQVTWSADPVNDTVTVDLLLTDSSAARMYQITDSLEPELQRVVEQPHLVLQFGDEGDYPIPKHGSSAEFAFDAYIEKDEYIYYGLVEKHFTLIRDDFLGIDLTLTSTENANDSVTFTWNETKGDYYLFQYRSSSRKNWTTLMTVDCEGERTYLVSGLQPYTHQEYRVIACYADQEEPVAGSSVISVDTESVLQYSTIWTIQKLDIYADAAKTQKVGTAKPGAAYCVLDLENGMFKVFYGSGYGYIDSNYCLINLPDFIGDLVKYDIKNSYSSIYKFHDFNIPEVTETIIIGYEKVQLTETTYLVPLLYPTALKLEKAAQAVRKDNMYLKIYDSFRPHKATTELFTVASEMCKLPITEEDLALLLPEQIPTPPADNPDYVYTYELFITDNGRLGLNYFLAKGISMHNRGLALDITLEKDGVDLEMQSPMHDLTWYSETQQNNNNAKKLARYMTSAGFGGLVSEWWHFQDNEVKETYAPAALEEGVTQECWMADNNGWRYRRENGTYYRNCTRTIGGVKYTFDSNGYVIGDILAPAEV